MATFFFYSPVHIEPWDHRSPDSPGIGGSETAVVELAARLAQRGHDVTVYAPIRDDCPPTDRGAKWLPLDAADFSLPGVWVLSRSPGSLDEFDCLHPDQLTVLVCQDVFYPDVRIDGVPISNGLTADRAAKLDICLPLCTAHERFLIERVPELKGKTRISSNGIKVDLIESIDPPNRDPFKLVYTSSPDRGLATLLKIFKRARELEPRLSLTAAYGFDNIDKMMAKEPENKYWPRVKKEIGDLMGQPSVTWKGRMGQREVCREFLSAGIWCYPTTFTETSAISCMEAQSMGAIPITNPLWALADNVRHGVFIEGDPAGDPLVRSQYVGEILRLTRNNAELQETIRGPMMTYVRERFDWERVVDQYEGFTKELKMPRNAGTKRTITDADRDRGYTCENVDPQKGRFKWTCLNCGHEYVLQSGSRYVVPAVPIWDVMIDGKKKTVCKSCNSASTSVAVVDLWSAEPALSG